MAKIHHRVFEMYESLEEAVDTLTPKPNQLRPENKSSESWTLRHLAVSRFAGVSHIEFKESQIFEKQLEQELREDLLQLAETLIRDSKVLFDFTGVTSIGATSIEALARFNQSLRNRGSRTALCCISPDVQPSFFSRSNACENHN